MMLIQQQSTIKNDVHITTHTTEQQCNSPLPLDYNDNEIDNQNDNKYNVDTSNQLKSLKKLKCNQQYNVTDFGHNIVCDIKRSNNKSLYKLYRYFTSYTDSDLTIHFDNTVFKVNRNIY